MNTINLINLQLFATHVNVTTDATSGNNLSAEMKTFYDMTLIDEAQAQLVHDQFGQVGAQAYLQEVYKLTADEVVANVKKVIARK